jgi:O-antigen ligase
MNRVVLISRFSAVLVIAAFLAAMMPFAQFEAESFLLCFLMASAAAIITVGCSEITIPKSPLIYIAALFWGLVLCSAALSEAPYISFIYFCFFSVFPLMALTALSVPDKTKFFRIVFIGLGFFLALLSVVSVMQYFGFHETLDFRGRTSWPLANPNSLAGVYMLGIFGAIALMLGGQNRLHSNAGLALAILFFTGLLTTGSRGAFISLVVGLMLFGALNPAHIRIHRRCVSLFIAVATLFVLVTVYAMPENVYTLGEAFRRALVYEAPLQTRPAIWFSAWQIIHDHFWTGTGIGTFYLYYPQYRGEDFSSAGYMAHNDTLQFGFEMGAGAPVLFLIFIALCVLRSRNALSRIDAADKRRIYISAPFSALGAMVLNSQVTYNFYVLPMLLLAGLLLGFWFYQTQMVLGHRDHVIRVQDGRVVYLFKSVALIFAVFLIYSFVALQGSYLLIQRAETKMEAGDLDGFARYVNRAGALSSGKNDQAYVLAATIPIGVIDAQKASLSASEIERLYKQADNLLSKAWALNPRLSSVLYYKAYLLYSVAEFMPSATNVTPEELLRQAVTLDPQYAAARLLLADMYEHKGEASRALDLLREGMKWGRAYTDKVTYFQRVAHLALAQGDIQTNRAALDQLYTYQHPQ